VIPEMEIFPWNGGCTAVVEQQVEKDCLKSEDKLKRPEPARNDAVCPPWLINLVKSWLIRAPSVMQI